jgi:hypothetical protein
VSIKEFYEKLNKTTKEIDRLRILRKIVFHGTPAVFNGNEEEFFEFRQLIAERFKVGFQEVFIVGSAKLGFSYVKETQFSYDSDVDVVIVNKDLFEYYFQLMCDYQYNLDQFKKIPSKRELADYNKFLQYLVKGWMRPDLLPYSFQDGKIKTEWFEFFESISNGKSNIGNYKVNAGLFKDYSFLEKYHLNGLNQVYQKIS